MMFKHRFHDAIVAGRITRTYRRWQRPQVIAGRTYKLANRGYIEVQAVKQAARITLKNTGLTSVAEAEALMGQTGTLYLIEFSYVGMRPDLAIDTTSSRSHAEWLDLRDKLYAKDARSDRGPWTLALLQAIGDTPGKSAAVLAAETGTDKTVLKRDVRKLKALGLTLSLETGYRLSPLGEAYIRNASLLD